MPFVHEKEYIPPRLISTQISLQTGVILGMGASTLQMAAGRCAIVKLYGHKLTSRSFNPSLSHETAAVGLLSPFMNACLQELVDLLAILNSMTVLRLNMDKL